MFFIHSEWLASVYTRTLPAKMFSCLLALESRGTVEQSVAEL